MVSATDIHDCIVVGAGITGLSCAYFLARQGIKTLVLEADEDLGGLLASYSFGTFAIEKYYHHFFTYDTVLLQLIEDLDLTDQIVWKRASTGYYHQGTIYNLDTPREIILFRGLTFIDKLLLSKAMIRIKLMKDFKHLDRITAREWLLKNTNQSVFNNFFAPLLRSKFGRAADEISAAWLCARLKLRSNRKVKGEELGYLYSGMESLIQKLTKAITDQGGSVLTKQRVRSITPDSDHVFTAELADKTFNSRAVVSTVAPSVLARLTPFSEQYQKQLMANKSQAVVCAMLGMKQPLLKTYWLNIRSEDLPFALLIEHTNFHDIPEYNKQKILYVAAYQEDENDTLYVRSDEEIIDLFFDGLKREFGLIQDNILWWRFARSPAVGPIYTVNYLENKLDRKTEMDGYFIGGMMTSYPERGISVSIEQGEQCALNVLQYLKLQD